MNPTRAEHVLWERFDDEAILYEPNGGQVHRLNRTGLAIWQELDGERDAEALAAALGSYTSWQDCVSGATDIGMPSIANPIDNVDVSNLFTSGGSFVCGDHTVVVTQCNSAGPSSVRSFDIVVS